MKVCSHCKTQNNDSANYCRQCGFVFPDVNLQSGNIDNSLVDKVNELQKRVSDAEANTNSAQREINTLNSKVSSLVSTNSNLQNKLTQTERQLSSANTALNNEKQKTLNAEKIANEEKKAKESAESSKNGLHTLYIIIIVIISIVAISQCNGNTQKESEITSLQSKKSELSNQVKKLKEENDRLTTTKNSLSSALEKLAKNNPIIINDISVRGDNGSYTTSSISRYAKNINSRLSIYSLTSGTIYIKEKFIYPWGTSYSDQTFYVSKNENTTLECSGWHTEGTWETGTYRFEYYYNGKLIGSKSFNIN